jgi:hypothetical protein
LGPYISGTPQSKRLCEVPVFNGEPQPLARCSLYSEWGFGSVAGNVFTADQHRTRTSTSASAEAPCPARVELSVAGDQIRLSGQLNAFLRTTCGADSAAPFTMSGFTNDEF